MSDGPHRSLPMRKLWKELAKRADQSVYDADKVAEAASLALAGDCINEVKWALVDALKSIFTGRDNSLLITEIALQELEGVKRLAAGSVFGVNAVAYGIELIGEGRFGLDSFYDAIGYAAKQRGAANIRQIEEHYLRNSNKLRTDHLKTRLTSAISSFSEGHLGAVVVNAYHTGVRASKKQIGLDAGVSFA